MTSFQVCALVSVLCPEILCSRLLDKVRSDQGLYVLLLSLAVAINTPLSPVTLDASWHLGCVMRSLRGEGPPLPPAAAVVALFSWCKSFPRLWKAAAPADPSATNILSQLHRLPILWGCGAKFLRFSWFGEIGIHWEKNYQKLLWLWLIPFQFPKWLRPEECRSGHFALEDFWNKKHCEKQMVIRKKIFSWTFETRLQLKIGNMCCWKIQFEEHTSLSHFWERE